MTSIKKLAIRGTVWTIAGYGTSQVLRFASNLVLTRLLAPDLFGLMALVNVFIMGLNLFSDIGIGPSIIQNKRGDDPAFLNTAWTLQVMRGVGIWLACCVIAFPISQFYEDSRLLWLIPVVGLGSVVSGFNSTALFTLNRKMALGRLTIYNAVIQVVALSIMLIWAWLSPTIWALVGGSLISSVVKTIWSHKLTEQIPNRLTWDRNAVKELFEFGRWIFISTAMTFLANQSDRLILGKLLSLEMLGVYTVAYTLSDIPRQVLLALSGRVIFPAASQLSSLPREEFRAKILKSNKPILLAVGLGLVVLVSFGDILITFLYDDRYDAGAWMLPLLALGLWPRILVNVTSSALFAVGQPRYNAYGNFSKLVFMVIGLPIAHSLIGALGAIIVIALNDIPYYLCVTYGLWREKLLDLRQDLLATGLLLAVVALMLLMRSALGLSSPITSLLN
jgi:O-antigen/teichoic acid export membrane protein